MRDYTQKAYALKRPNGKLAMSSVGSPVWYADKERAEQANLYAWGTENEVVEVVLERDCACYNGYMVKEEVQ